MKTPAQKFSNSLFFFAILPALVFQFIAAWLYFGETPIINSSGIYSATAPQIYTISKVLIFAWPLLFLKSLQKHSPSWGYEASRHFPSTATALLKGALLGLLFSLIIFAFYLLAQATLLPAAPQIQEKAALFHLQNPLNYVFFSIFLSLIHSFLEEYYWRYFIFRGLLLKLRTFPAALLGSLTFAAHHYLVLYQFFPLSLALVLGTLVGAGGFLWCILYRKTGSLLAPWISHALVDASLMTVGYFLLF